MMGEHGDPGSRPRRRRRRGRAEPAERILIGRVGLLLEDVDDVEGVLDAFADLDAALDREADRFRSGMEDERADG